MLTNSEEKIFLEAIDQYFDSPENNLNPIEPVLTEKDLADNTSIITLNVKFCENLDEEDTSTEGESEENSQNSSINISKNTKILYVNDFLSISEAEVKKQKDKIINAFNEHQELMKKIKAIFKNDKNSKDN